MRKFKVKHSPDFNAKASELVWKFDRQKLHQESKINWRRFILPTDVTVSGNIHCNAVKELVIVTEQNASHVISEILNSPFIKNQVLDLAIKQVKTELFRQIYLQCEDWNCAIIYSHCLNSIKCSSTFEMLANLYDYEYSENMFAGRPSTTSESLILVRRKCKMFSLNRKFLGFGYEYDYIYNGNVSGAFGEFDIRYNNVLNNRIFLKNKFANTVGSRYSDQVDYEINLDFIDYGKVVADKKAAGEWR